MIRRRSHAVLAVALLVTCSFQTFRACRLEKRLERAEQYVASGTMSWFNVCMQVHARLEQPFETYEARSMAWFLARTCAGHKQDVQQQLFDAAHQSVGFSARLIAQHLWIRLDARELPLVYNFVDREMLPKGYR